MTKSTRFMFLDRILLFRQNYFRLGITNLKPFFDEFFVKIFCIIIQNRLNNSAFPDYYFCELYKQMKKVLFEDD